MKISALGMNSKLPDKEYEAFYKPSPAYLCIFTFYPSLPPLPFPRTYLLLLPRAKHFWSVWLAKIASWRSVDPSSYKTLCLSCTVFKKIFVWTFHRTYIYLWKMEDSPIVGQHSRMASSSWSKERAFCFRHSTSLSFSVILTPFLD